MNEPGFPPQRLRAFAEAVLRKAGAGAEAAANVAEVLVYADRRGIRSHGVGKLGDYVKRVEAGVLDPAALTEVLRDNAVTALLDAHNGFGQSAAIQAMDMASRKAEAHGLGMVLVRNSNHFGIASYYSLMAARKGMIGVASTNASPGIAPFGAKEKLFGTNPVSVAIPTATMFPVVLDMSSSVVARGKVRQALAAGGEIPFGWARDADGAPTTDPAAALKGTLEPIAGPKGSGLALAVEVLCGVLSGSALPGGVRVITDTGGPCHTGHLLLAVNPDCFAERADFLADMDKAIAKLKALTPIGDEVLAPGELEWRHEQASGRDGVVMGGNAIAALTELGRRYGVPFEGGDGDDA